MERTLSGRQIRAARALADISQEALAQAIGLTPQAIRKIESDDVRPREGTLRDILRAFNDRGIEFTENNGVRQRNDDMTKLIGKDVYVRLLDDVILTLKDQPNPEALFFCVCDQVSPPPVIENYRRLRRHNIKMRSLIKEGDTYLMGQVNEYRAIPAHFFHNNAMVLYGDKFATVILDPLTGVDSSIIILKNPHISLAQRNLFNLIWSCTKEISTTTSKVRYDE